ncbi:MAG TPA: sigma-70 family RNA polymerase sigma factor [Actinobacteria bacterium]|nr:RNA polymerase sigma-E factor [bacterium BMS3Bbin02]HDL41409.1 sigma-70 family RNA polymerase sigma factor [Actinomycetota bacterium]
MSMARSRNHTQPFRPAQRDQGMESDFDANIYNKHRDELVRYATALVGPDEAEDVLSTVLVKVLRRRSLASLDNPEAYLFRAVLNQSRSVWRQRQRPQLVRDERLEHAPDPLPEVVDALRDLPPRQRAATYLVYFVDLSVSETAELMGCTQGSVKRHLFDARRRLAKDRRLDREQT